MWQPVPPPSLVWWIRGVTLPPATDKEANMSEKTGTAQIGVVGMAVMGSNLARNFASKGFKTAIFNRS